MIKKNSLNDFIINAVLILVTMVLLYPTLIAFFSSFKTLTDLLSNPVALLPSKFVFDGWKNLFNTIPAATWLLNGLLISIGGATINILITTPAAYIFSRTSSKIANTYFKFIIATVMLPLAAYMVPLYSIMSMLKLVNTFTSVILPISESVFGVFYLTQSFRNIPIYYEEVALVDGCNQLNAFWKVFLPIAKGPIITIFIFTFIWKWNSFLWPLMVLNDVNKFPLTLGIATTVGNDISWINSLMAGAIFTITPIVIIYTIFHRYIVDSSILSGIK